MKRILPFLAMLFVLPIMVSATDRNFYFDASAADGGDGSLSSPFNELGDVSWDAVHNNIISGNDVYLLLKRGEIFLVPDNWAGWRFKAGGTPDNRIYVTSYGSGNMPIIDGRGGQRGLYLSGSDYGRNSGYITVDGIEIRNGYDAIEGPQITHLVVKNCKFHDFLLRCVSVGSNAVIGGAPGEGNEMYNCGRGTGGCDVCINNPDVVVSYNHLYATKSNGDDTDRGIDGVAAACEGQRPSRCHDILIEYNEIHDHNDNYYGNYADHGQNGRGEDGVDLKNAYNVTVRYNHIYNHFYQSGITVQMDSHDIDIYGNAIHDNYWPNVYLMDGVDNQEPRGESVNNINIWGNLIFDGESDGIRVAKQSGSNPDPVKDVNIFNNVIAGNAKGDVSNERTGIMVYPGCTGTVIKNNVFYKNRPDKTDYRQVYVSDPGTTILDNNLYYWPGHTSVVYWGSSGDKTIAELKALGQEQGGSDEDPGLIDPDNNDYMLLDGSPCIGTGEDLGPDYNDLLHPSADWTTTPPSVVTMQQEADWVRGAYGYTGETQNCSEQGGYCCISPQTCPGTDLGTTSDCTGTCCSESCQSPPQTCTDLGYHCCDSCVAGTEHPENDTDCSGQVCCGECLQEPPPVGEYNYSILKTHTQLAIDGNPEEFSGAPAITITEPATGASGTYRLIWDEQALYIAASFQDTQLNAQHTDNESNIWEDDSLEIMFDTLHDKGSSIRQDDYKFFVNVRGARMDSKGFDSKWNTTMRYAVDASGTVNVNTDTDTGWILEMAIPWQPWGITPPGFGSSWGMNIKLNDLTASGKYSDVWSQSGLDVNAPDGWNDALFTVRADTSRDGCMDMAELTDFIDLWRYDSTAYPMSEMMEAVALWSRGTGCT